MGGTLAVLYGIHVFTWHTCTCYCDVHVTCSQSHSENPILRVCSLYDLSAEQFHECLCLVSRNDVEQRDHREEESFRLYEGGGGGGGGRGEREGGGGMRPGREGGK